MPAKEAISKIDAVRQALKELGNDAKPGAIVDFVKKLGVEMTTGHVSNYKTSILKRGKKRGRKKATETVDGTAPVSVATPKVKSGAISIEDIEAVKGLVSKVGEENLKTLVGLLG